MEKYPLEALLSVRRYREDGAKRGARAAEEALRTARADAEAKADELEKFKVWRKSEEDRRFDAIMGTKMTLRDIDVFKRGLAKLAVEEEDHVLAVEKAEKHVKDCNTALDAAREKAKRAQKETAKIDAHKDIWSEEAKKEEERREDLELEEFKPVSRMGAMAEGEDM